MTATGNVRGPVAPMTYVDAGYPDVPTARLTLWGDVATRAPGTPAIQYAPGDLVMHDAALYRARTANSNRVPPDHPADWEPLPLPADDLRVPEDSPYAALGVR